MRSTGVPDPKITITSFSRPWKPSTVFTSTRRSASATAAGAAVGAAVGATTLAPPLASTASAADAVAESRLRAELALAALSLIHI